MSFGFEKMELNRIGAIVFIENVASNQLLAHLGFHKEGVLKEYMYQQGKHMIQMYMLFLMISHKAMSPNSPFSAFGLAG